MKKIAPLILSALIISMFGTSVVMADVIPEGQKYIDGCAYLTNIAQFSGYAFVEVHESYDETPVKVASTKKLDSTTCIHEGKYDPMTVFAIDAKVWALQGSDRHYNPFNDFNAYPIEMNGTDRFNAMDELVGIGSSDTFMHREYVIQGFDNSRKTTVIAHTADKSSTSTQNFTAPKAGVNVSSTILMDGPIFKDVNVTSPYAKALLALKRLKAVNGYPDGTYKPFKTINRAEFTTATMATYKTSKSYDCAVKYFTDVPTTADTWYRNPVCLARNEGVVAGYSDRTFRPTNKVNYAEAAAILVNAYHFTPGDQIVPWYKKFTSVFERLNAVPSTIKVPDQFITRGEMALLMYALIENSGGLQNY